MAARRQKRARKVEREQAKLPSFAARRYGVLGIFALAAVVLVWRAFDQQILEKDFLQSEGADRYLDRVEMMAHRGLITDRRGEVLALSTPVDSVAANPRVLRADSPALAPLAESLHMPLGKLRRKLAQSSHKHFVYLKKRMAPSEAKYVLDVARANELDGVQIEREYRRYYPAGEVFAHVLGFTNYQDSGQEGLERAYNTALSGRSGSKLVLRDGHRRVVDDIENIRSPRDGKNLALSLDGRLQYIAYRELKAAVKRNRAIGGTAVILDARSGEVLAMVNQPGFNPNGSRSNRGGRLRNRAVTDVFEPGSTMKPFAVASALELGVVKPDDIIDTAPGYLRVKGGTVRDHHNLKKIDLETLLGKSSNVGAAKLAMAMEREDYWQLLDGFGFGRSTDTGFPAEAGGQLLSWRRWAEIDQATLSFGYGISVSALQLARAYAVLANDGVEEPVTLLKRSDPPKGHRVISARTAEEVRHMLESVTERGGTAPKAAIPGYRVAGKTGTVKKLGKDGYEDDRYLSVFAGMAPLSHPRLVMVVMINEPRGKNYYGGQVAGPVFSKVMGEALRLLNIKPDALSKSPTRLAQLGARQ
jgi:cell division protein FtsI (penicillin-binding protein 3)